MLHKTHDDISLYMSCLHGVAPATKKVSYQRFLQQLSHTTFRARFPNSCVRLEQDGGDLWGWSAIFPASSIYMWGSILAIVENGQKGVQWSTLFNNIVEVGYLSPGQGVVGNIEPFRKKCISLSMSMINP